ncbi:YacL family protein [Thalassotalea marina]|uniref:Uncharacterized protein n=1 Tax=Thalassotalea marina TaxID=1673741 RepID=A0A919EHN8_9GAMM|nr:YacL family protein [Thalassotalea marina]GHF79748.1 hypothetical protein GCM10017161_03670 [Thalassotalea marina]
MEYEFIHDGITGSARAQFSLEHQLMGPWLETEIGQDVEKLSNVLKALDAAEHQQQEFQLVGKEYTLTINHEDVCVNMNVMLNGEMVMPDELTSDALSFDYTEGASCGVDDFRELLRSWANFRNF